MNMRPVFRIMAKNKATGRSVEVAAVWPSKIDGLYNVSFHVDPSDERQQDIRAIDLGSHYINMLPVKDRRREDDF